MAASRRARIDDPGLRDDRWLASRAGSRSFEAVWFGMMDDQITPELIGSILAEAGVPPTTGGDGTLFGEPLLVFIQLPTDLARAYRYAYVTADARVLAWAQEAVGPPPDADQASWQELFDHLQTDVVAVSDPHGATLLAMSHKKVWKSKITVADGSGRLTGRMRQKNIFGRLKIEMEAAGQRAGRLISDSSRMLGWDLVDGAGATYGRMIKVGKLYGTRVGVHPVATTLKVPACFVLHFSRRPPHPQLAVAAPLAVDLSMNLDPGMRRSLVKGPGTAPA